MVRLVSERRLFDWVVMCQVMIINDYASGKFEVREMTSGPLGSIQFGMHRWNKPLVTT